MPNVRMPDGVVVAFPEEMPPDQIRSLIASKFPDVTPKPQPQQRPLLDIVKEKLSPSSPFGTAIVAALGADLRQGTKLLGEAAVGGFKQGIGGIKQSYGELGWLGRTVLNPGEFLTDKKALMPTPEELKVGQEGKKLYEEGAKQSQEAMQAGGKDLASRLILDVTGAVAQSAPAVILGALTRSPTVGLAAFAPGSWGQNYGEARSKGKTPFEAASEARFKTGTDVATERIPLGWILKEGKPILKRLLDATVGEGLQEGFNQFLNEGYDSGVFNDKTPLKDALAKWLANPETYQKSLYAMGVGAAAGGVMGAAVHPFLPGEKAAPEVPPTEAPTVPTEPAQAAPTEPAQAAPETVQPTPEEVTPNAQQVTEAAQLHGDVQQQPGPQEGPRQVSPEEGSQGVRAGGQAEEITAAKQLTPESVKAAQSPKVDTALYSNPIEAVWKGYQAVADKLIEGSERALSPLTALGNVAEGDKYLGERQKLLGTMTRINEAVERVTGTFEGLDKETAQKVYEYLITKEGSTENIPNLTVTQREKGAKRVIQVRDRARAVKRLFNQIGDKLVEEGMIPAESREAFRDMYLPRVYLKHIIEGQSHGMGARLSKGERYKKRSDIPEEWRRIMGEVTDPAYLSGVGLTVPMRDLAITSFLRNLSDNSKWVVPEYMVPVHYDTSSGQVRATLGGKGDRNVSVYYLEAESQRLMKQATHMTGDARAQTEQLAKDLLEIHEAAVQDLPAVDQKKFKQVPKTRQYGPIQGLWLDKQIYEDLFPGKDQHGYPRMEAAVRIWKMIKVPMNYPTVVRNLISNSVLMHMGGVPFPLIPVRIGQAIKEIRTNGPHWRVAKKYGIKESTFTANELYEMDRTFTRLMARNDISATEGIPLWKVRNTLEAFIQAHSNFYQGSEQVYKTAMIIDQMKQGVDEVDAVMAANDALFDYSLLPAWAKSLRKNIIGVPFLTFYYKAMGQVARTILRRPHLVLGYYALWEGLKALTRAANDIDEDDLKRLMKDLPTWLQDKGYVWILPYKDEDNRWQALDIGYILPWAAHQQTINNLAKGEWKDALQEMGFLGTPIASIVTAVLSNKDAFTGKDIINPLDSPGKQATDLMNYIWRLGMPSYMTDIGALGHMYRAMTEQKDVRKTFYGQPLSTETQALLRAVGINLYPVDPEKTRDANLLQMKYQLLDLKKLMKKRIQELQPGASSEERRSIVDEFTSRILELKAKMVDYQEQSKLTEKIKVKKESVQ